MPGDTNSIGGDPSVEAVDSLLGRRFGSPTGLWRVEALVDARRGTLALLRSEDGRLREVAIEALVNGSGYRSIDDGSAGDS